MINITWNIPTVPNGIIIIYEIRYRESNSNGPYNMTNTTNTQYSIGGLLPNTNYTIGVRAYTSVGAGEWSNTHISTSNIRKSLVCHFNCLYGFLYSYSLLQKSVTLQYMLCGNLFHKSNTVVSIILVLVNVKDSLIWITGPFLADRSEGLIGRLQDNFL